MKPGAFSETTAALPILFPIDITVAMVSSDESFPLNPAREDKKESDVDSRGDEDELKTSNEDDVGDQLNASVASDTDLVGKWRFAFEDF